MRREGRGFRRSMRAAALAVLAGLLPWACTHPPEPLVYETNRELKPGPGLFSGEDGVFTIYGVPQDPPTDHPGE